MKNFDLFSSIKKSKFCKRYLYDKHWISGSSTIVYPISYFWDTRNGCIDCTIQINDDKFRSLKIVKKVFEELIEHLKNNGVVILMSYVSSYYDGSCPRTAFIKIEMTEEQRNKVRNKIINQ